ncbi:hypothetical protein AAE478_000365 [Parahypoxylon ruwenzoriense]
MASRVLAAGTRTAVRRFHATARTLTDATTPLPARKPVGAFRGGLFGFLLGATLAGGGVYGYVLLVGPPISYVFVPRSAPFALPPTRWDWAPVPGA